MQPARVPDPLSKMPSVLGLVIGRRGHIFLHQVHQGEAGPVTVTGARGCLNNGSPVFADRIAVDHGPAGVKEEMVGRALDPVITMSAGAPANSDASKR